MTSGRGRPTEPLEVRRASVLNALFEAVTALLAGGGTYVDVSVNAMVAEAGIAKSTFYQYFSGKNDLLRAFVDQVVDTAGDSYDWIAFEGPPSPEAVISAVRSHVLEFLPYMPLMAAAFEAAYFDPEVRGTVDRLFESLNRGLSDHIRVGQEHSVIDPELPPAETAMWLTWMASRGVHRLLPVSDEKQLERLIDGIGRLMWSALYRPCVGASADAQGMAVRE